MKTRSLLLLGCLLAVAVQAATTKREMWVWKDANGVPQYSDVPRPGAKRIEIVGSAPANPVPVDTPANPPRAGESSEEGRSSEDPRSTYVRYESLSFVAPEQEQSFFSSDGTVAVQLQSTPELSVDDRLVIYLDGKPADAPESAYQVTLSGVERGEHVLTATIFDAEGIPKIDSAPRKFFMQPNVVNNPANRGPALKPKPTPLPAPPPAPTPPKSSK